MLISDEYNFPLNEKKKKNLLTQSAGIQIFMSSIVNISKRAPESKESDRSACAASPDPTETTLAEVTRLRTELAQCQEKFALWKEKAKGGVDSLRAQIIDLTQRLDRSEEKRVNELRTSSALQSSTSASADVVTAHSFAVACLLTDALHAQSAASTKGAASATSPLPQPSPDGVIRKLERTIQDQSDRLKETHHALRRSTNEVQQRIEALQRQDEVVAALRRRVEALEAANIALEEQLMNVPNVEEWRAAQDELDHQLERSRLEYEHRESVLVLQHSNEIQSLNAAHEQDFREIQRDADERVAQTVQTALASQAQALATATAQAVQQQQQQQQKRGSDDEVYMNLLRDYKALEASSSSAVKERDAMLQQRKTLLRELHDLFRATGTGAMGVAGPPQSSGDVSADTLTAEDAIQQIGEQRVRCVALQEELARCRREIVQLKRSRPSVPVDGLGAQQTQYVRSVVVQLLCSLHDATVAKRLLPVLSMLLKFSDDDLKAVTRAMPQWSQQRR